MLFYTVKPRGIISTPLKGRLDLESLLSRRTMERQYLLNRLDRGAYGVVLFTSDTDLYHAMRHRWKQSVRRFYRVLTTGPLPTGETQLCLRRWGHKCVESPDGVLCRSVVLSSKAVGRYWYSRLENLSGYTHQVRKLAQHHLCSVLGETLYAKEQRRVPFEGLALEAYRVVLEFSHGGRSYGQDIRAPLSRQFSSFIVSHLRYVLGTGIAG